MLAISKNLENVEVIKDLVILRCVVPSERIENLSNLLFFLSFNQFLKEAFNNIEEIPARLLFNLNTTASNVI